MKEIYAQDSFEACGETKLALASSIAKQHNYKGKIDGRYFKSRGNWCVIRCSR